MLISKVHKEMRLTDKIKFFHAIIFIWIVVIILMPSAVSAGTIAPPPPNLGGLPDRPLQEVLMNFMNWLLAIVGFVAIISFAVSGIMYFVSAGDDKMIDNAKRGFKYSVIGIAVVLGAFVVIQAIDRMLRGWSF